MKIDRLADCVNRKFYLAKVLLEQWRKQKELALQQGSQFADLLLPAQEQAFEESVSYFLVFGFKALVYELLASCGTKAEFIQALRQADLTDPTNNQAFLKLLIEFRKTSPELSQLALWAQQESEGLHRLLMHYASYGFTALEEKKVENANAIPLQEVGVSYEELANIHRQLTQLVAQFREQMQEF